MARMCELCGKQAQVGHNVSHSNRKTKRVFRPNIFGKKIFDPISKVFVWLKICTRCIRTVAKKTAKYV